MPDEEKVSITVPAPKLLCLIYTVEKSHSTLVRAIRDTWGGGCDGFLAFSSSSDPRLPAIKTDMIGTESYKKYVAEISEHLEICWSQLFGRI